ncbi:MAG: preprotein translocase subunit SecG [Campylobacterales bacterium]
MESILLTTQIVLAVILTIVVLLQKSSSIGLGAYSGGGSNDTVFGAKGASGFLTKVTFTLGFVFVVNTVALTYIYNTSKDDSVINMIDENSAPLAPESTKSPAPSAPNGSAPTLPDTKE